MTLGDLISAIKFWLRSKVRRWLEIDANRSELWNRCDELEAELNDRITQKDFNTAIQNLQNQISGMGQIRESVVPPREPEEDFQVMSGHVPFSQRKRNYEIRMQKPKETPAGKQIEENARLIASATRKTDKG